MQRASNLQSVSFKFLIFILDGLKMKNFEDELLRRLFEVAISAADPMKVVPSNLPDKPNGRVVVIGAGKGSARMAEAVENVWGPCEGIVLTPYGYARPTQGIEIVEAAHPVSDLMGVQSTNRILKLAHQLKEDDFVLGLISGGGSALLCSPEAGIGLSEKQALQRDLLKSGMPIGKINVVRKYLSRVKGGQLAAAVYPARMLNFLISDVPGDHLADIASGPTVGEDSTSEDALAIIEEYKIQLPTSIKKVFLNRRTLISEKDIRLSQTKNQVISAPSQSLEAAKADAEIKGYDAIIISDSIEGEARIEAVRQVAVARDVQKNLGRGARPVLLLSGGECTVSSWHGGIGGPNAEFALAAAIELEGQPGISLLSCDTDGIDGSSEVAGAVVFPNTLFRAKSLGLDPSDFLSRNDSNTFFSKLGNQVKTGPTLTNVNDFRAILVQTE